MAFKLELSVNQVNLVIKGLEIAASESSSLSGLIQATCQSQAKAEQVKKDTPKKSDEAKKSDAPKKPDKKESK